MPLSQWRKNRTSGPGSAGDASIAASSSNLSSAIGRAPNTIRPSLAAAGVQLDRPAVPRSDPFVAFLHGGLERGHRPLDGRSCLARFTPPSHPKVVAERLGHDGVVLLRTYSHVVPSLQREAAESAGAAIWGA